MAGMEGKQNEIKVNEIIFNSLQYLKDNPFILIVLSIKYSL